MLYLDSSALVKVYFKEKGSEAVIARAARPGSGNLYVCAQFCRGSIRDGSQHRERLLTSQELTKAPRTFESDWSILLNVVELDLQTMAALPKLVEQYPLKAADAIQLSTAIWLKGRFNPTFLLRERSPGIRRC